MKLGELAQVDTKKALGWGLAIGVAGFVAYKVFAKEAAPTGAGGKIPTGGTAKTKDTRPFSSSGPTGVMPGGARFGWYMNNISGQMKLWESQKNLPGSGNMKPALLANLTAWENLAKLDVSKGLLHAVDIGPILTTAAAARAALSDVQKRETPFFPWTPESAAR